MKTILLIPALALMFVSCKKDEKEVAVKDATQIKIEALEKQLEDQKMEMAKQTAIDSMQMINELKLPIAISAAPAPVKTRVVYVKQKPRKVDQAPAAQAPVQTPTPTVAESPTVSDAPATGPIAEAPVPEKKKGWSNTAKGAVIGAGVGAIGGAVINKKNRVKGAIIGGVIGAVAGTGTGVILDKRKQKAEEQFQF